jgi:hypothetical protein
MRVLGFSKRWPKLQQELFTTCRFPRKDRDWTVSEVVQIVYHPRSKDREILAFAQIVDKEPKTLLGKLPNSFTDKEAQEDGFNDWPDMENWLAKIYGKWRPTDINKLTLKVVRRACKEA